MAVTGVAGVVEGVDAADAGPEHVARLERVALAVGLGLDLAVEDDVGLFHRMVVRLGATTGLVLDHEDRVQLGIEALVDEHGRSSLEGNVEQALAAAQDGKACLRRG